MLATACETAALNELTIQEAHRGLIEAIDFPPANASQLATQLLDELSHSVLIQTSAGISSRCGLTVNTSPLKNSTTRALTDSRELAYSGDVPVDTWQNAMRYLAEMNGKVRQ